MKQDAPDPALAGPFGAPVYRLGRYREYPVPGDLREIVDAIWVYGTPVAVAGTGAHRVLPHTGLSLCFRCVRDREGRVRRPALLAIGPVRSIRFFDPGPGLHLEAVRIRPEWCRFLLGLAPEEHVDALDDLSPARSWAVPIRDRLARTRDSREAVAGLSDALRRLREGRRPDEAASILAHLALDRLRALPGRTGHRGGRGSRGGGGTSPGGRTHGLPRLYDVARSLRLSERHLRRVIRSTTGESPKYLQRMARLDRAVAAADGLSDPDWPRIALEAGYYDQAHMIGEFRSATGLTPTALHAERRREDRAFAEVD